jgi:tetratricopeptide (TPR) repeat protein
LRDYGVALNLAPDYIEARYHRAQLYRSFQADQEALLDFRALWRTWHSDHDVTPIPYRQLAADVNYLMQAGNVDKAWRVLHSQAGTFREDSEDDLHERACLYERVGQLDFALDDWERLARLILSRQATPQMAVS